MKIPVGIDVYNHWVLPHTGIVNFLQTLHEITRHLLTRILHGKVNTTASDSVVDDICHCNPYVDRCLFDVVFLTCVLQKFCDEVARLNEIISAGFVNWWTVVLNVIPSPLTENIGDVVHVPTLGRFPWKWQIWDHNDTFRSQDLDFIGALCLSGWKHCSVNQCPTILLLRFHIQTRGQCERLWCWEHVQVITLWFKPNEPI